MPICIAENESSIEAEQVVSNSSQNVPKKVSSLLLNSSLGGMFLTSILKAPFTGIQALFTVCFRSELSSNL